MHGVTLTASLNTNPKCKHQILHIDTNPLHIDTNPLMDINTNPYGIPY